MEGSSTDLAVSTSAHTFRPDIEGLRGIAVLLVVGCHCGISWCAGGFVGVDIFFVISGYLITGLLEREYRENSRIDFRGFFARRVRRLLPACVLVLAATTLVGALILSPQEVAATARAALASALYASNIFFDQASSDYFAPAVQRNPLLHTWSLGVEEQFYLAWPALMLCAYRWERARPVLLAAATASSFLCGALTTRSAPTFAFYELPARTWEFAAGGLLALILARKTSIGSGRWPAAGGVGGLALILGAAVWIKGGSGFPGWVALIPVIGTLLILFAGASAPHSGASALLGTAPLRYLGARSYSWYLWHWPFMVFATVVFPTVSVGQKIEAAVASLLAAELTYHWVEQPVRTSRFLVRRPGLSLLGAAGAASLTMVMFAALASVARQQLQFDLRFKLVEAASMDVGFEPRRCYSEGSSFEAKLCVYGDPRAARTVVLFGDSHAMQWINAMRKVSELQGWRLITAVRPGCAASDINPHNLATTVDRCKGWRAQAIDKILDIAPSAVLMASYNGSTVQGDALTSTLMPVDEIRSGTRSTLLKFSAANIPVVVLRDSPLPPFNVPACIGRALARGDPKSDACEFDASVALNQSAFLAERAAGDGLANVHYLDMDDLICPGKACPAVQHGRIIYRDENHLAGSYAESLATEVGRRLTRLLQDQPLTARGLGG